MKSTVSHSTVLLQLNKTSENTFVIPDSDDEDKRHPVPSSFMRGSLVSCASLLTVMICIQHYYVDETELRGLLEETGFRVEELREVDHRPSGGHWHWHLLASTRL